jgi:hypothetical protein
MPGNGNSLASRYFDISAEEAGGMGDTLPLGGAWGPNDKIDAEADGDCMRGACTCTGEGTEICFISL